MGTLCNGLLLRPNLWVEETCAELLSEASQFCVGFGFFFIENIPASPLS